MRSLFVQMPLNPMCFVSFVQGRVFSPDSIQESFMLSKTLLIHLAFRRYALTYPGVRRRSPKLK
jgi:hypothetical protein